MNIVLILQTSQVFNDRENRQLVTNEPVEVRDCRKITDHFRRIYRIYPNLIKENRRMRTCHRFGFANTRISTGYAQKSSQSLRVLSTKKLFIYSYLTSCMERRASLCAWENAKKYALNYYMMVKRYRNLKEEVGGSIPGCEIFSLLDIKLVRWSIDSYTLALACRPYV